MQTTYRDILNQAYLDRSSANPSYSMRSFARDLGISASTLSEVLSGKKGISPKRALQFAKTIRLPEWQVQMFCDLVTQDHAKSPSTRESARERLQHLKQENSVRLLNQSAARALTSWVDLAILELTYLKDFKPSPSWISKKLGIESTVAAKSIERLKAVDLLKVDSETGTWIDASPLFSTTDGIPSDSIRAFHRSVLQLAIQKLETKSVEERTVKTAVVSLSGDRIQRAKNILDEAIGKIVSLADESSQEREDILCFSLQLFSVLESKGNL